ncbi:MAG: two-component regulator propeller domain-containing protein, partial [Bacteroidales bacterium]
MKSIINFLLVYFSLFLMPMYGQTVHFKSLTTDNGLSQISVNSIFQDENRLVWIGTRDGLNRYDGQNIRIFKLEKNNPNSLFCNNVLQITGNKKGRLFLRCTEGICAFDFRTEQFRVLATGDYGAILYKDELYIARKNEIYIWNDSIGRYEFFYQLLPKGA